MRSFVVRGEYWALVDKTTFGADAPNAWVAVPPDRMLDRRDNPMGEAVLCWLHGRVLCFVWGVEG